MSDEIERATRPITELELHRPPPAVIALMAHIPIDVPAEIKATGCSATVVLIRHWDRMIEEFMKARGI